MDIATDHMLEKIIQQNNKLAKQQEEIIRLSRLELPITQLPIDESELAFLIFRGTKKLSDILAPNFFDLQDVKEHQELIALLEGWGYTIITPDDILIEDIDLPVRVQNALKKHGIDKLAKLIETPPNALTKKIGVKSINDIRIALNKLGYDW